MISSSHAFCTAEVGRVSDVFTSPASDIARELILQGTHGGEESFGGRKLRLVFDGSTTTQPVISSLVLASQAPVNIVFADTHEIDGCTYGHMIVELPQDERQCEKIISWLDAHKIQYSREED